MAAIAVANSLPLLGACQCFVSRKFTPQRSVDRLKHRSGFLKNRFFVLWISCLFFCGRFLISPPPPPPSVPPAAALAALAALPALAAWPTRCRCWAPVSFFVYRNFIPQRSVDRLKHRNGFLKIWGRGNRSYSKNTVSKRSFFPAVKILSNSFFVLWLFRLFFDVHPPARLRRRAPASLAACTCATASGSRAAGEGRLRRSARA